ncbi:MAG: hypothetical protein Q4P83_05585, partial [Spirochaetales bacterium]|nr:hypothetical protein [Spirochaetales bacterium]
TVNIFFNATMYDKMQSENLRSFFRYLCGKNSDDNFTDRLSALVERVKMNAQWRHRYMTIEQEIKLQVETRTNERLNEKLNEKLDESKLEIAKNLLKINISPEQIAMATGLSLEQVKNLETGEI